jgi:hypothetical protein
MPTMSGAPGCMRKRMCERFLSYSGAVKIIRRGHVALAADDNGSISIWRRNDTGKLRAGFYRYLFTVDERDFATFKEMRDWLRNWYPKMAAQSEKKGTSA